MPKCIIDGREAEFSAGENLIEVAKRVGIEIPVFCYHPGLTVVAQCRMCMVDIEKMPKLQTACSTPAAEGMVVKTKSDRVEKAQKATMEFLLVNHPLDCPICDKSGECDLQDNSYKYGDPHMRSTEERRTYLDVDMGPVIQKNMNRCIHCTRCIRFGDEVAGIREMVALQRGNNTEITTIDGKQLQTQYAGNYSDICPTGSLTLKDFRFKKRAWFLKKTATVCDGCSRGCNTELQHEGGTVYRAIPRSNPEVNRHWMCDEGRFLYRDITHHHDRVLEPAKSSATGASAGLEMTTWGAALTAAREAIRPGGTTVLVGTDLTQEELGMLVGFAKDALGGAKVFHFGTAGVTTASADGKEDEILRMKSKTGNLHGAEKLGIAPWSGTISKDSSYLVVRGGRAALPVDLVKAGSGAKWVGIGVFQREEAKGARAVLPGLSFAEKDGTLVNFQGKEQRLTRAILPLGKSKALSEAIMLWSHSGAQS